MCPSTRVVGLSGTQPELVCESAHVTHQPTRVSLNNEIVLFFIKDSPLTRECSPLDWLLTANRRRVTANRRRLADCVHRAPTAGANPYVFHERPPNGCVTGRSGSSRCVVPGLPSPWRLLSPRKSTRNCSCFFYVGDRSSKGHLPSLLPGTTSTPSLPVRPPPPHCPPVPATSPAALHVTAGHSVLGLQGGRGLHGGAARGLGVHAG